MRRRILRAFVGRGLIESVDAKEMLGYQHSGFSVDAGVLIEAHDRAALERLLRYCACPPFAMDRLRKEGAALVYRCAKQHSKPGSDKRGAKADELHLTPLELIDRIAALVPPPRTHRHRYFGVLAPNSPLRVAAVALAQPPPRQAEQANISEGEPGVVPLGHAISPTPESAPPKRSPAHYLWAVLIARIYEVFPRRFWITSESTRSPHTHPRRAGHRRGRTVMRRWVMVCNSSRTGIWLCNPHSTTR